MIGALDRWQLGQATAFAIPENGQEDRSAALDAAFAIEMERHIFHRQEPRCAMLSFVHSYSNSFEGPKLPIEQANPRSSDSI